MKPNTRKQPPRKPERASSEEHATESKPLARRLTFDFRCPVQSRCGGCQLSGTAYQDQLKLKQKRVTELLGKFGPISPILGMERPYHYRNKVHAVLGTDKSGMPVSGVYAYGTHRLVPVKSCLL